MSLNGFAHQWHDDGEGNKIHESAVINWERVSIGSGNEISIAQLSDKIQRLVGYDGEVRWNTSMPDGQLKRRLDVGKALGEFSFRAQTSLEIGLKQTVDWYQTQRIIGNV